MRFRNPEGSLILRKPQRWLGLVPGAFLCFLVLGATDSAADPSFHSGGAGRCSGCHTLHGTPTASEPLLRSADSSSVCLNCHAGPGGANSANVFSPDGSALTPGGDFYWMTRDFSWLDGQSPANDHGHNVVASDYNLLADPLLTTAPGGTYPAAQLGCTSCHDPHGTVAGGTLGGGSPVASSGSYGGTAPQGTLSGNYRLLGGASYQPPGGSAFANDAPVARQSSVRKYLETDTSHVAYGAGMSAWCGNCHADMASHKHRTATGTFQHATDRVLGSNFSSTYNSYVRTGDFSGTSATAYLQFVPFERGINDPLLLDPHSTEGPSTTARIMCLTCHRAHASAFPDAGRWDFTADLLVNSHPAVGDTGATTSDVYFSYYGRDLASEFGSSQGSFCEKCHGASLP